MAAPPISRPPARIAFSHPAFLRFQSARFFTVLATEMQSVAVGWQVYEITHRPLDLGLVGLAQFLPTVLLFLIAGHVADRYDRRKLLITCYAGYAACSALLLFAAVRHVTHVYPIYAVLLLLGVVRSFSGPVSRAIQPQLVPPEHFANAVAWSSSI
jgi:MFS family permease